MDRKRSFESTRKDELINLIKKEKIRFLSEDFIPLTSNESSEEENLFENLNFISRFKEEKRLAENEEIKLRINKSRKTENRIKKKQILKSTNRKSIKEETPSTSADCSDKESLILIDSGSDIIMTCNSEESSVDLNNLEGYHDFNKSDLIKYDSDSSSYSSYCEIMGESDDKAEVSPDFGCVSLNINLNKESKSTKFKLNIKNEAINEKSTKKNDLNNNKPSNPLYQLDLNFNNTPDLTSLNKKSQTNVYANQTTAKFVYPWISRAYSPNIIGLHQEIKDFYEYSKIKQEEIKVRNYVFMQIKEIILEKWPDAEVYLFGSFLTGLSLPFADLDIVVFNPVKNIPFYNVQHMLVKKGLTSLKNVKIISKATVPIIKFIHNQTHLSVDLSFNCKDGPSAIHLINKYRQKYPALSKLLLVIKLFLHQRGLNFAYTGGISSYSLTLMMIAFFQQHPRANAKDENVNLGVLLLEFFELYGIVFNYKLLGIRIKDGEGFANKNSLKCSRGNNETGICIEDPLDCFNNPSKNCSRFSLIKNAFHNAYYLLTRKIKVSASNNNRGSILSDLIAYKPEEIRVREKVLEFHCNEFELKNDRNKNKLIFDFQSDFISFNEFVPLEPIIDFKKEE